MGSKTDYKLNIFHPNVFCFVCMKLLNIVTNKKKWGGVFGQLKLHTHFSVHVLVVLEKYYK